MQPFVLTPIVRIAILVAVFMTVVGLVLAMSTVANARAGVRRRLDERLAPASPAAGATLRGDATDRGWVRFINLIEERGLSLADTKDEKLRTRMIAAGYTHPIAPRLYTFIRLVMTLGLPTLYVTLAYASGSPPGIIKLYFIGSALAVLGLYLPNVWVSARTDRRKTAVINGFPDALDLMLVCTEAGLSLEASFARVGKEVMRLHPLLAELFAAAVLEMRAGRSREDALRRMADRAQIDEIHGFTTLLIQSTNLGSSIGQTLRVYAAEMRESRRMRAEEKAHRLPVLLSIPLVTCMLPVMIGVLMLPAAIRVIRVIIPALG